jgi:uncharacterized membrane protein
LLVGLTLLVRRAYHGADMASAPAIDVEMWSYSAVWALFGAGVFWLGMRRSEALLRWIALTILLATTAYVFFLTFTRLSGVVQFGSVLGLAVVLMAVAWAARAYRAAPPGPLLTIGPGARRERRSDRR